MINFCYSKPVWKDGTTATVVLVINDTLFVASLGDSQVWIEFCVQKHFPYAKLLKEICKLFILFVVVIVCYLGDVKSRVAYEMCDCKIFPYPWEI